MLTRLKVTGFKNLDVDVRFGPFTCIAGCNGVGKSNLFDAILFLSALAQKPLLDAALSVRSADVRSLFHHLGSNFAERMSLEAEMLIPRSGTDDLGQSAEATVTFLRYKLELGYRPDDLAGAVDRLVILSERLDHVKKLEARPSLPFPSSKPWRDSVLRGKEKAHRTVPFLSTSDDKISFHQDGGSRGRPLQYRASTLSRTILSTATNIAEGPTAALARKEMASWRLLQLEPAAMRSPDAFTAPSELAVNGSHLASALYHLSAVASAGNGRAIPSDPQRLFSHVGNRLAELIDDVLEVHVDRDEQRKLLSLIVTGKDGTGHSAQALSDGTLRFLALSVIERDPRFTGLLCLEEPENGIHPSRIESMIRLLYDIANDPLDAVDADNPLRQVIVNTHSPLVVAKVKDGDLVYAGLREEIDHNSRKRFQLLSLSALDGTWRTPEMPSVAKGLILAYLTTGVVPASDERDEAAHMRRVGEREDLQLSLQFGA